MVNSPINIRFNVFDNSIVLSVRKISFSYGYVIFFYN
jgi:hypothetical protein